MKHSRIKITAYYPPKNRKQNPFDNNNKIKEKEFVVQANPEQYSMQYTAEYSTKNQSPGDGSYSPKWIKTKPTTLSLDIIFDGTGAIPKYETKTEENDAKKQALEAKDVQKAIREFWEMTMKVNKETHGPNYLLIVWGNSLVYYCRLTDMKITYKLFNPEGRPLRAVITATFQEVVYKDIDRRNPPRESPDVTHVLTVKDGDTLATMAKGVYGDEQYYLSVARANKLIQFRNLRPGTQIHFPPIKKT